MLNSHLLAVHWNSEYEVQREVSASERGQTQWKYRVFTHKNGNYGWLCQKASTRGCTAVERNLWTDANKMKLYQNDGKRKLWRKTEKGFDLKQTAFICQTRWRECYGIWICMAADRTGSLAFIDYVTADRSSRMNCEVLRLSFTVQK